MHSLKNLSGSGSWGVVLRAPGGGAGAGGGAGDGQQEEEDQFDEDDLNLEDDDDQGPLLEGQEDGLDDDDEINLDDDGILDALYPKKKKEEEENLDDDDLEDAGDSPEAQKAIADAVRAAIDGISTPEDLIPEDFDPSDRKQLRELLAKNQRQTVENTMRIMWQPIGAALQQTIVRMRQEIRANVKDGVGGSQLNQLLDRHIPIHTDRRFRGVVQEIVKTAKSRFGDNHVKVVAATKKALTAMGVSVTGKRTSGGGAPSRGGSPRDRTNQVLDMFAQLPAAAGRSGGTQDRLKNRIRKP